MNQIKKLPSLEYFMKVKLMFFNTHNFDNKKCNARVLLNARVLDFLLIGNRKFQKFYWENNYILIWQLRFISKWDLLKTYDRKNWIFLQKIIFSCKFWSSYFSLKHISWKARSKRNIDLKFQLILIHFLRTRHILAMY